MGVLIPRQVVEIKDVTQKIESKARIEAVAQSDNQSQSCVSREQKAHATCTGDNNTERYFAKKDWNLRVLRFGSFNSKQVEGINNQWTVSGRMSEHRDSESMSVGSCESWEKEFVKGDKKMHNTYNDQFNITIIGSPFINSFLATYYIIKFCFKEM